MRSSTTLGFTVPNVHKRSANNEFTAQRINSRITPVAISIDPSDVSKSFKQCRGFTFMFLSDLNSEVIRRYDWLHVGGCPERQGPQPTKAAVATPLCLIRTLECGAALAAKSCNRARLTRDPPTKDFTRKMSRRLLVVQALATHLSVIQP